MTAVDQKIIDAVIAKGRDQGCGDAPKNRSFHRIHLRFILSASVCFGNKAVAFMIKMRYNKANGNESERIP